MTIKVMGPDGITYLLTSEQFRVAEPVMVAVLNGSLNLQFANRVVLQKLEDAGLPVVFEEQL